MTEDILHAMSYEKLAGSFRSGEADCDHHDAMAKSTPTKVGKANKDGSKMRMLLSCDTAKIIGSKRTERITQTFTLASG